MKNTEDLWGDWIQPENIKNEVSASIDILNPENKKQKGLVSEEEFNKVFADFL